MWTRNYGAGPDGLGVFWRWTSVSRCGQGTMASWARRLVCFGVLCANRTREVKRDFCDLSIRRSEGRVVNTPLVVRKGSFSGDTKKKRGPERKGEESPGERTDGRRRRDGKKREETERESGRERE
ncbi:hypothetical protein TNCV_1303761 [Trichonephila clavipes]|nr:hypothetical protein TNCV_1303761 [Trichonephila clavipes]